MGIAVAGVLAVLAPAFASMMRDARVVPILRVLSVALAIRSTAIVSDAMLRRRLEFKKQVVIETSSYVVGYGCVAVGLALSGYGVWSLVWGALAETLLSSIAQIAVVRHEIRPMLARQELEQLLGFGAGATMSAWANYVALNGDYFVVGRSMGAASLGLYVRAYTLMKLPHTYVASALSRVMFPAFASVQTEPARLRRGYLLLTEVVAIVAAPSMAVLAVVAPHFVRGAVRTAMDRARWFLCKFSAWAGTPVSLSSRQRRRAERRAGVSGAVARSDLRGVGHRRRRDRIALRPRGRRCGCQRCHRLHVRSVRSSRSAGDRRDVGRIFSSSARRIVSLRSWPGALRYRSGCCSRQAARRAARSRSPLWPPRRCRGPPAWSGWWLARNASRCGNGCPRGARGLSRPWARVERLARSHDEGA